MALIAGSVIRKDLKVYIRHRKTLLLIFIAPILIMVLIGSVFSGASGEGFKDIKLGVGGGSEQGEQIIKELRSNRMFIIIQENTTDPSVIEEGVRRGKYSAGVLIPQDEASALKLYVDNSRIQIAPGILSAFLSTTEKLSYELTFGFISKLWKNLAQMESELKPLREGILQINGSMAGLNRDTRHVLVSLDEINVTGLNRSIIEMKGTLDMMRSDLYRTADDINATRLELKELDSNVSSIYNDSVQLRDDLKFVIDSIDSADAALLAIQNDLENASRTACADPSAPQCVSLANATRQIRDTRAQILERSGRIRALHSNLANIAQSSAELHEKLNRTDMRLQNMQASISNYTLEISNIYGNLASIEDTITALGNVKEKSAGVSIQMESLTSEMANSTQDLVSDIDRTKDVLGEVIARSPSVIAAPIKLEQNPVFTGRSYLDFLMPGIISIVLMFVSFLLASITIVQERAKRTLVRTLLTPLSLPGFIAAKTSALILIALLQGIILIAVAFVFYGIVVPVNQLGLLFLVILVYSASFIGIGMALATFAESENTAMLMSLVLSIPMLFLCGIFFPFEAMPQLMVQLGSALPITMGIRALEAVLIYQEGLGALTGYLLRLLVYGAAGLGTAYLFLRREVAD